MNISATVKVKIDNRIVHTEVACMTSLGSLRFTEHVNKERNCLFMLHQ